MAACSASLANRPRNPIFCIQLPAGVVAMMAIANLQDALKNLRGEDTYALA